jgi:hypothetical protein
MPNRPCTKNNPTGPLCMCTACYEKYASTMRRVFTRGFEEGPELDWDYEKTGTIENIEWSE